MISNSNSLVAEISVCTILRTFCCKLRVNFSTLKSVDKTNDDKDRNVGCFKMLQVL